MNPLRILLAALPPFLLLLDATAAGRGEKRYGPAFYDRIRQKGNAYVLVGFPYQWNFVTATVMPGHARERSVGFYGLPPISVGYYCADRLSVRGEFSAPTTFSLIESIFGESRLFTQFNFGAVSCYDFRHGSFSLGPNLSLDRWRRHLGKCRHDPYSGGSATTRIGTEPYRPGPAYVCRDKYWTAGLYADAFLTWRNTRLGLVYRPSIYRFGRYSGYSYNHSVSVELRWRINLGQQ